MKYELFRGYVPTKNKRSVMKFKDSPVLSYEQVEPLEEYAGVLNDNTVLIDVDDKAQSDILMNIVEELQIDCRVYQTTRGRHFLFRNDQRITKCATNTALAVGLHSDIKVGVNSLQVLKFNGETRFIEWDIIDDSHDYAVVPKWLLPVKANTDFLSMAEGDGRNQALFNYILTLQSAGFTKDECRECIQIMNKHVLKKPLSDGEINTILRDDAFSKPIFFEKSKFLFDKFANYLISNYHIAKINGQLHIFKDGYYKFGYEEIQKKMIDLIPNLKDSQRNEVLKYLELVAPEKEVSNANYIAFKNGVYNVLTDTIEPYTPDIIITNMIPWDYNPKAYHELADKTLNKIACYDDDVRLLFEEYIGYNFYRRNELGKAFIFTGDKSNGKSTFLDVMNVIMGEENTSALDIRELGDRFSTEMLFGKLSNIGDDIGDEFLSGTAVSLFKKIVTGNRIKAERKGQPAFTFSPYVKLSFSANEMPKMRDKTGAVIRRLVMIPCDAKFSKDDDDYRPFIKYELIERSAIEYFIRIGIEGLKRVLENNTFTEPARCVERLKEFELENDNFLQFVDEIDVDEIDGRITNEVFLRYTSSLTGSQVAVNKFSFSKRICKHFDLRTVQKKIDGKVCQIFVKN